MTALPSAKLGLALGAGGAKGFAHVGVIDVLTRAGYEIDAVSGSSIGAIVGALLALGRTPGELDDELRRLFSPEVVEMLMRLSLSGASPGRRRMIELLREACGERTIESLPLPLTIMAIDLDAGRLVALRSGPLWEALAAATALPGMFAPFELRGRRMIDALALAPLPSAELPGADITVAVDLLGGETLDGGVQPAPAPQPRLLAALGELIELVAADASRAAAARADVVVRPTFGPCTWRDFALADQFVRAGRLVAERALPALARLVRPSIQTTRIEGEHDAREPVHA